MIILNYSPALSYNTYMCIWKKIDTLYYICGNKHHLFNISVSGPICTDVRERSSLVRELILEQIQFNRRRE